MARHFRGHFPPVSPLYEDYYVRADLGTFEALRWTKSGTFKFTRTGDAWGDQKMGTKKWGPKLSLVHENFREHNI